MFNNILTTTATGGGYSSILFLVVIFVVFYFFLIRPENKRKKKLNEMRSALSIGDEIVTIGGIIGIIVSMKEDSLVIETGSDRSKVRLARWAISGKNTTAEPK